MEYCISDFFTSQQVHYISMYGCIYFKATFLYKILNQRTLSDILISEHYLITFRHNTVFEFW